MDLVAQHLYFANKTGLCPVCRKRKRALWKDGAGLRMTCGDKLCFIKWIPGRHVKIKDGLANTGNEE